MKPLVEKGANIADMDNDGRTARHWAILGEGSDATNPRRQNSRP